MLVISRGGRRNGSLMGLRVSEWNDAKLPQRYSRFARPFKHSQAGELNPNAKLTNEQRQQVIQIRIEQRLTHAKIAGIMGVSTNCIRQLLVKARVA